MRALVTDRGFLARSVNLISENPIGWGASIKDVPKPTISENEILVNFVDFIALSSSLTGCDLAGVVVGIGSTGSWKVGDRVAGFVQGGVTAEHGTFAEYVKAEHDLVWKILDAITDEAASTYGISAVTTMKVLHLHLETPWTDYLAINERTNNTSTILIYGGSSALGLFAIQLAKNAGCKVVTTASPRSFELVKSYGSDHVYDYKSPSAIRDIKTDHPDISQALDCISESRTTDFCAQVLQSSGGKVITTLPTKIPGVTVQGFMSFQLLCRAFAWLPPVGPRYSVSSSDRQPLVRFYGTLGMLTETLRPPTITVLSNGLDDVLTGLERLRAGKVSGSKLVVRLKREERLDIMEIWT